jgi:HicA toxin of bacterial toxin-antitoxin,
MNSRDVIKALKKDGWYEVSQAGSHKQFMHATKKGPLHGAASGTGFPGSNPQEH